MQRVMDMYSCLQLNSNPDSSFRKITTPYALHRAASLFGKMVLIGHHEVIFEEYTNVERIHVNCSASIEFCWLKLGRLPRDTLNASDFKIEIKYQYKFF
jgi:hypothetical protein